MKKYFNLELNVLLDFLFKGNGYTFKGNNSDIEMVTSSIICSYS